MAMWNSLGGLGILCGTATEGVWRGNRGCLVWPAAIVSRDALGSVGWPWRSFSYVHMLCTDHCPASPRVAGTTAAACWPERVPGSFLPLSLQTCRQRRRYPAPARLWGHVWAATASPPWNPADWNHKLCDVLIFTSQMDNDCTHWGKKLQASILKTGLTTY